MDSRHTGAYHHGALRRAVLDAAVEVLDTEGPDGLRLRDLARRIGVSHAAPAHHFGDRVGLLTAVAIEGFDLLADALDGVDDLLERGVAYVRFGTRHRPYFEVMFRTDLHRRDDPDLLRARERAGALLRSGVEAQTQSRGDTALAGAAAWSIAHGFATLANTGNLDLGDADAADAARPVLRLLFERPGS
jgi:AcrR family transcriptional regulator